MVTSRVRLGFKTVGGKVIDFSGKWGHGTVKTFMTNNMGYYDYFDLFKKFLLLTQFLFLCVILFPENSRNTLNDRDVILVEKQEKSEGYFLQELLHVYTV